MSRSTTDEHARTRDRAAQRLVIGPVSGRLALVTVVVILASAGAVAPFVLIVEACRALLDGIADSAMTLSIVALILLGLRGVLYSSSLLWTHLIDADHQLTLRRMLAVKLARVPLGWFTERHSGDVKKILQDDIEAVHDLIAHARVEFISAVSVPLFTLAYLLYVDWRLSLVLLVPLVAYLVALRAMMGRNYRDKLQTYNEWEKRTESTIVEFVGGIQVVRTFGQTGRAHHRFQSAVNGFAQYFKAWATPMTTIEASSGVLLNPVFLLFVVLLAGLPLVQGGMSPINLLPFIFVGIGLGSTVLTVGYASQSLTKAREAMLRIHTIAETSELEIDTAPTPPSDAADGHVRFESVRGYVPLSGGNSLHRARVSGS